METRVHADNDVQIDERPANLWQVAEVAATLLRNGRTEDAQALLANGQTMFPEHPRLFIDHAAIAEAAHDWPEVIRRFTVVRERFPDEWWAYARIAIALRHLGRLDEADRILEEGQRQLPGEAALFIDHGTVAEARGDWPEVIRRFTAVKERFPDGWWAYARIAIALRHLGRLDEADRILEEGQQQIPGEAALFIDHGTVAEARGDWPEVIRRFTVVKERFPDGWWAYARIAIALRHLGRLDEADRILEEGQQQIPGEAALFIDHGTVAEARGDWPEVIRRFTVVKERFPGRVVGLCPHRHRPAPSGPARRGRPHPGGGPATDPRGSGPVHRPRHRRRGARGLARGHPPLHRGQGAVPRRVVGLCTHRRGLA